MTPWTVACQAPLPWNSLSKNTGVVKKKKEYWSGLPFPSPGDLPDPGIKPRSPALQADSLLSEPQGKPFSDRESKKAESQGVRLEGCHFLS